MTSRIGKYRVEKELGAGGFGKVYLAFDPDVGQPVAIKKLHAGGDPDLLKRFQLEIRTTASLRHKNIVTIHASGEEAGDPYLVMEFLEGYTLKQVIQARRPLSLLEKVHIMSQVAEGLAYAHSKGVVHRDVKPENIMLMPDDNVKIMDFGIALGPERNTNVTQTGGIIGTPPYFAPEQLEGSKANEQTDIFSFGDVYYELLTGAHPFEQHKGEWRTLQLAILTYEPRSLGELLPGCPEALETLVHRTLAKQPEFRYQKFEEVQLDNEAIMVDLKHESAAAILREVPSLIESGYLQSALSKIRVAYQLAPGNREVRRVRDEINLRIQGEQRQKQLGELLANADKQMNEGRFAEAVQSLELGIKLDSNNIVVAGRLEEAKVRRDNYIQANRLVSEARFNQQKGFLTEAHQKIQEALSVDPDNTDAKRLSQRIGDELKRRQLDQKLQQALRAAREHRAAQRFAEGLAVLDDIEREIPGAPAVADLRADIQNEAAEEQRRIRAERFNMAVSRTREVMDSGDLDRARQMLEHLSANFSSEPGAGEMLPSLRERLSNLCRARDVAQYQQRVHALLKDKAFRDALDVLAEARQKFPDDIGLDRLNKTADELYVAQQRAEAIAAVLRDATGRRDAGDLQGALDIIVAARRQLGDEAAFTDLAHLLEMEIAQQRYIAGLDSLLRDGRALLSAGKYSEAVDRLVADKQFSGEAEVRALLESARAEAAIEEERRFVEDTLAAAGKLQSEESWTRALSAVELGLAKYPQNSRLGRTADRLRDRVERERQRGLVEAHRGAIRREIEAQRWTRAQAALAKARAEFPTELAFHDLSDQVEAGLYEQGWQDLAARINQHLTAGGVSQAEQELENPATRTLYQQDPRWKALAEQVARRRAYEDALAEAERRRKDGALSEAEALLTHVISQGTPDMRALHMRGAIQSQRSESARQQEIARIAEGVRERLKQDDLAQADSELAAARSRYPGENSWAELQAQLDARQQAVRRKAEIAKALENVRQALTRDDIPQAVAALSEARSRFSGESIWSDLDAQIKNRQAVLKRESEIGGVAESVRRSLRRDPIGDDPRGTIQKRRDDLRKSTTELEGGRKKYPGEKLWDTLQAEIDARRAFLDAESKIADNVARCLERGEIAQAEAQLSAGRNDFPDEGLWGLIGSGIAQRRAVEKQRAEVAALAGNIEERLQRDALPEAGAELKAARAKYPSEPAWKELQARIEARRAVLDRNAEIGSVAEQLRGQLDQEIHRVLFPAAQSSVEAYPIAAVWEVLRAAGSRLEQARARYPGEAVWDTLQTEMAGRESRLEREVTDFVRACQDFAAVDANQRQLAAARTRFPREPFWAVLEAEIRARREPLERASIAEFEGRVRECLNQGDLPTARTRLDAARQQHPGAARWNAIQTEIDRQQAQLKRREELDAVERSVREQLDQVGRLAAQPERSKLLELQWEAFRNARAAVDETLPRYPGETRLVALQTEIGARRAQWEKEVAQGVATIIANRPAEGFSALPIISGIAAVDAKDPGNPLWARLKGDLDRASITRFEGRVRECLNQGDLQTARTRLDAARKQHPGAPAWTALQGEIDRQLAELKRREELDAAERSVREQLDQVGRLAAQPERSKLLELQWEAFQNARAAADAALVRYPGETRLVALQTEIGARRAQWEKEVAQGVATIIANRPAEGFAALPIISDIAAVDAKDPGNPLWARLRGDLERASITRFEARVRESLNQGDLQTARTRLDAARKQHPGAPAWTALQGEIDRQQAELQRREELDAAERTIRGHLDQVKRLAGEPQRSKLLELQWEAFQNARVAVDAALVRYPGESRLVTLQTEIGARRAQWEKEVAQGIRDLIGPRPVKGFSTRPIISEIAVLNTRDPGSPLWARLKSEIDATEAALARQAEVAAAGERVRAALQRDDIRQAISDLNSARARYPNEALWTTLQAEIDAWHARQQERLREKRDQARDGLLALERQCDTDIPKRQRKKLDAQAREVVASYPQDPEILAIADRIHRRVEGAQTPTSASKPIPWKLVAAGGGGALVVIAAAALFLHRKPPEPPKPPIITPVSVEIRTDPPGASVRIGDHSCVTPNCRVELAPGSYPVEAKLDKYEPKQQTVQIDASSRLVDLTLNPVAPAAPPPTAVAGTLVVQAGVADALVYVDNVPQRNRTDGAGSASLPVEAKAHEVRVEKNGYVRSDSKRVTITPGGRQTVAFRLAPENARIELSGAIANLELRVDGSAIGRTDGSATFLFPAPVKPGDRTLEVSQGRLQTGQGAGSRSVTQRFEPGQTVRLSWKPDPLPAPATPSVPTPAPVTVTTPPAETKVETKKGPSPEEIEERDWDKVRDSSDPAQLRDFRKKYANGRHAKDAEAAIDRLAWTATKKDSVESLRAYVQEFPAGAHVGEANTQIGEFAWKNVDPNNIDQLRKFAEENPTSPHTREAQRKLDQVSATQDVLRKQVVDALNKLNIEFNRKPVKEAKVKETWPGVTKMFLESLKQPGQEISLVPIEEAKVQGDVATVRCNLNTAQGRVKSQVATVVLRYGGGRWLISEVKVAQ